MYHPSMGGVGRQALLLTEKLAEAGLPAMVIARKMNGLPLFTSSPNIPIIRAWSVDPWLHNFEDVTLKNIMVSFSFSISCAFLLLLNRQRYDIVHFHGASLPLFVNLPLLKLLRKKVIAKVAGTMGTEPGSLGGKFFGLGNLIVRMLRMVDRFVATTEEIESGLLREGFAPQLIVRIPNFINTDRWPPPAAGICNEESFTRVAGKGATVIYCGRFIACKGINHLFDAWVLVTREFPDARLVMLGDGPLFEEMRQYATRLGIDGTVDFCGHVTDVSEQLKGGDIFVLPSLMEGMPNSLLEAMASGLPVVATSIGGVTDIVCHGENGILVQPADSGDMARGILTLLNDRELAARIAANGVNTIKARYSLSEISLKYLDLYRKLVAPKFDS
jgi:glycosyltransferase involved in cell wall biosynthesis